MTSQNLQNYVQIPDQYFNEVIPKLTTGAEVRVLFLIMCKTLGENRKRAAISDSEFLEAGVIDGETVVEAIERLKKLKILKFVQLDDGKTKIYLRRSEK